MDLIRRDSAINIIADKQRELCPLGRFSRNVLYGTDREKFDAWQEIIDTMEGLPCIETSSTVPLEPLCEWMAKHCMGVVTGVPEGEPDPCKNPAFWKAILLKWMEELSDGR